MNIRTGDMVRFKPYKVKEVLATPNEYDKRILPIIRENKIHKISKTEIRYEDNYYWLEGYENNDYIGMWHHSWLDKVDTMLLEEELFTL